jgi:transcriptional regulator with XRE-family HTH domain
MSRLSDNIRTRRLALGLTQEELAARVGYRSKSSVNKIELGARGVRPEDVETFARALETSPAALMGFDAPTGPEAQLLALVRQLSPEEQEKLLTSLEALLQAQAPGADPPV